MSVIRKERAMKLERFLTLCILPLVLSCATNGVHREDEVQAERANAASEWRPAPAEEVQLAVEVEIRADGITPVGASVVQAPAKTHSAIQDLRVTASGGGQPLAQYAMADPRIAEVDGEGRRVLDSVRTFIFAPLSPALATITVEPLPTAQEGVSRGGTLDAVPLLRKACEQERNMSLCQQILRAYPQ
jgi:hypothetical protein